MKKLSISQIAVFSIFLLISLSGCSDVGENYIQESELNLSSPLTGKLTKVSETGQYELFEVLVEVNDQELSFNYNGYNSNLNELIGKSVEIHFDEILETNHIDIVIDGVSIHGEHGGIKNYNGVIDPSWSILKGILIAEELTLGDNPSEFQIELESGEHKSFEAYVDEDYISNSGKMVTLYYSNMIRRTITSIKAL